MARASGRVKLVVPRDEAENVLERSIARGESVARDAQGIRDEETFRQWAQEATRWRKFAVAALHSVSEGDALDQEFTSVASGPSFASVGGAPLSVADRLERRQRTHHAELNVLRSVVERLPLFPAPDATPDAAGANSAPLGRDVFVVHGRQHDAAEILARFVERLGLRAVILDEQPNRGKTLIEKFESNAETVGFAVVLLLSDDWGRGPDDPDWPAEPNRARQNVVLELGYFVGKLGREHVVALMGEAVERPSDIHGLAYIPFDDDWRMRLFKEMKVVFTDLDANKAFE